jgi:hypothetical protein
MYRLINDNIAAILAKIKQRENVDIYDDLMLNRNRADADDYQNDYKKYWQLHMGRLSDDFCKVYFNKLKDNLANPTSLSQVVDDLYDMEPNKNGNSIQFSFASKLWHMVEPTSPLYDSLVARYYFFNVPTDKDWTKRRDKLLTFYEFLIYEYKRVIDNKLLEPSILDFRRRFYSRTLFTDDRIIDFLIWSCVTELATVGKSSRTLDIFYGNGGLIPA